MTFTCHFTTFTKLFNHLFSYEDNLYEEVTEEEYNNIKRTRGSEFVIGEDYEDDGHDMFEEPNSTPKTDTKLAKKQTFGSKLAASNKSIKQMFAKQQKSSKPKKLELANDKQIEDELDDILGNIKDKPEKRPKFKSLKKQQEANPFKRKVKSSTPNPPASKRKASPPREPVKTEFPTTPVANKISNMKLDNEPDEKKAKLDVQSQSPENPLPKILQKPTDTSNFSEDDDFDIDLSDEEVEKNLKPTKKQTEAVEATPTLSPVPPLSPKPSQARKLEYFDDNSLQFYYIDAYEDRYAHPGTIWLTGKVCIDRNRREFERVSKNTTKKFSYF